MKTISIVLIVITLTTIKMSLQLFSNPDMTNPTIPERFRRECGYRISYKSFPNKCYIKSKEQNVIIPENRAPKRIPEKRVKDGRDVVYREAPWVVHITKKYPGLGYRTHCTGSLITSQHILTAAHCNAPLLYLFVGEDTIQRRNPITHYNISIHYNYIAGNSFQFIYDIAVITLHTPLDFDKLNSNQYINAKYRHIFRVNTICLPQRVDIDPPPHVAEDRFEPAVFYGWGLYREDMLPQKLQRGDIDIQYRDPHIYQRYLFQSRENGTQACHGDSGAGIVQYLDESETRAVLIGVQISIRNRTNLPRPLCNDEYVAQTYAVRVAKHLYWINEQIEGVEKEIDIEFPFTIPDL